MLQGSRSRLTWEGAKKGGPSQQYTLLRAGKEAKSVWKTGKPGTACMLISAAAGKLHTCDLLHRRSGRLCATLS